MPIPNAPTRSYAAVRGASDHAAWRAATLARLCRESDDPGHASHLRDSGSVQPPRIGSGRSGGQRRTARTGPLLRGAGKRFSRPRLAGAPWRAELDLAPETSE
jgi:hypothetical protein